MPLVTVHRTGSNWRAFEFEDCGKITTIADLLAQSLRTEFENNIVTEIIVCGQILAIKFTKVLPSNWCLKVIDAAQTCVQMHHGTYQNVALHIVE